MGFEGEFASYEPLRRILTSERIEALQKTLQIKHSKKKEDINYDDLTVKKTELESSNVQPDLVLAIDGSKLSHPVENGFPGAELGYITVASVLIDLVKVDRIEKQDFINPKKFRETETVSSFESMFPGCNIVFENERNAKTTLRKHLFDEFKRTKIFSDGESLLDTFEYLFKLKLENDNINTRPKSPLDELKDTDEKMQYGFGEFECKTTGQKLFSTDALRLHELMNPSGSNGDMFGQIMSVLEKLFLLNVLRYFELKETKEGGWYKTLRRLAIIVDGPLAVFSTASWLNKSIEKELSRINGLQKEINGKDLLLIGLEKSGIFFNHFLEIDISKEGISDDFPKETALLLDNKYIKENIIFSESIKQYGADTYFGRKILYKTKSGQILIPVIAYYSIKQKDMRTAKPNQFPRLGDVMNLLDMLVSSRHPNSVSPLISAHAEAAIPLNLGKRIFEDIAREIRNS